MNEEIELYLTLKYDFWPFNRIEEARDAFDKLPLEYFEEYGRVYWNNGTRTYRIGPTSDDRYSHTEVRKEVLKRLYEYDRRR